MLFPLQQSITFMIPVSFVHCQGFLRNWSMTLHTNRWHMLIFSAIFKVFLCFGRLLPFPSFQWVSLKFSRFSFALGGFCQKTWKSCTFLVSFGFWIVTNKSRWHMVYFLCKFQFFPLLWTASAKLLKKSQFPSFWWVSLPFSCSYSALGRSIWDNCWKSCNFHAFPTAGKSHFYDFIALRGPNPVSFVHCQGFLRNLSMSLQCHYTQTDGIWLIFSAIFKVFLCFGRLLPFPSFQWVSPQFSKFSFALCQKCWKSCTNFLERVRSWVTWVLERKGAGGVSAVRSTHTNWHKQLACHFDAILFHC